jgi:hypothetical protein
VHASFKFTAGSAVFDGQNPVSSAGLVPVLDLAEQAGLSRRISEHVDLPSTRVKSGTGQPGRQADLDHRRNHVRRRQHRQCQRAARGGTPRVFDEVYAPSTLGIFLREFTFGHANQLAAVARAHLVALAQRVPLLPVAEERVFIDTDSDGCWWAFTGEHIGGPRMDVGKIA